VNKDGGNRKLKSAWMIAMMLLLQQPNVSDPLSLDYEGKTLISATRTDYSLPGQSMVDTAKLERLIEKIDRMTYQPPVNAKIGDNGKIIPEQLGYRLNREAFTEQFYAYFYGGGPVRTGLARIAVYPRVDSELLANIRQKPIGQYVTYYNSRNKNRSHNLVLAAKMINNHVVFPGEVFSFNQVVGRRTEDRGYLRAPVIVRGELSEGIGGGICQVSSTLFNATDRAGLQIVQRYSHSRDVPYVLPGRDATVSWGGPDFSFQNQYNQPVLIRSFAGGGTMFVSIHSSDSIEYKPRVVPGTSKRLPEEVSSETESRN
jgi:vancomycin resistance protein YoaR